MTDTPGPKRTDSHSRATRRRVLQATAGALAVGTVSGRGAAQQATGPTVYVGSGGASGDDRTLYAVDAATGEQEWAFTQPSKEVEVPPTVVDGTVYVGSGDETLYALDAATGEQEWAFPQPYSGGLSSPTVVADPESGDSVGSRVMLGTLGHHGGWRYAGQNIDV
jgi:outer membrane protein assembly factor BamB